MIRKRGLSNNIKIFLLILLIVITAIIIILVIRKSIDTPADKLTLKLKTEEVRIINENTLGVKVAVDSGDGKISGINFVIDNGEQYEIIKKDATLDELGGEFILDLKKINLNEYTKISASPVFKLNSGEIITGKSGETYSIYEEYLNFIGENETVCTDSCFSLGYECGNKIICEVNINCGTCLSGYNCQTNGTCIKDACIDSCNSLNYSCGNYSICGNSVNCGTCLSGFTCQISNGTCMKDNCIVMSYTPALNTFCGTRNVVTNCGTTISKIGTLTCTSPQTCGGGGTANACGCTATTCSAQGKNCGTISNGCGETLNCGTCSTGTCVNNVCTIPPTGAIIINHLNTDITQIPASCITKAKTLTFQYAHRSDGGNILEGLSYVYNKNNAFKSAYQVNSLPSQTSPIQLRIMDGNPPQPDYSYAENYWNSADGRAATEANWASGNFDASMWSWCSEFNQGTDQSALANSYLNIMNGMEANYPNIKFVYMTSYGDYRDSNIASANQIIRNYATNNEKILYDFEDIGRCDPDGNCYSSATRDCSWCSTWCASHSSYCTNLPSTCAHTHGLLCAQRASAFWWMMARLAGWDGNPSSSC